MGSAPVPVDKVIVHNRYSQSVCRGGEQHCLVEACPRVQGVPCLSPCSGFPTDWHSTTSRMEDQCSVRISERGAGRETGDPGPGLRSSRQDMQHLSNNSLWRRLWGTVDSGK